MEWHSCMHVCVFCIQAASHRKRTMGFYVRNSRVSTQRVEQAKYKKTKMGYAFSAKEALSDAGLVCMVFAESINSQMDKRFHIDSVQLCI